MKNKMNFFILIFLFHHKFFGILSVFVYLLPTYFNIYFSSLDNFQYLFLACSFCLSLLFSYYYFIIVLLVLIITLYLVISSHFFLYLEKKIMIIHIFYLSQNSSLCLWDHLCSYTRNEFCKQKQCIKS